MTAPNVIPILAILLGPAIVGLGIAGIAWIIASHFLGHGLGAIAICGVLLIANNIATSPNACQSLKFVVSNYSRIHSYREAHGREPLDRLPRLQGHIDDACED